MAVSKARKNAFAGITTDGADEAKNRLTSGKAEPTEAQEPAQTTSTEEPAGPAHVEPEQATGTRTRGRPRNPDTITSGGNRGLKQGDARVTIVESEEMLMWYRDYAYTMGLTRREAIHNALQMYRDHVEGEGVEVRQNPRFKR